MQQRQKAPRSQLTARGPRALLPLCVTSVQVSEQLRQPVHRWAHKRKAKWIMATQALHLERPRELHMQRLQHLVMLKVLLAAVLQPGGWPVPVLRAAPRWWGRWPIQVLRAAAL